MMAQGARCKVQGARRLQRLQHHMTAGQRKVLVCAHGDAPTGLMAVPEHGSSAAGVGSWQCTYRADAVRDAAGRAVPAQGLGLKDSWSYG